MDVDCSSKRSISRDVLVSLAVFRTVFIIFTCHLINTLEWWKCGDKVMWLMHCLCRNCSNFSTVKGGPLLEYRVLGGPYQDMPSWNFWTRDSAVLEVMWNRKGYLLNRLAISR